MERLTCLQNPIRSANETECVGPRINGFATTAAVITVLSLLIHGFGLRWHSNRVYCGMGVVARLFALLLSAYASHARLHARLVDEPRERARRATHFPSSGSAKSSIMEP